MIAGLSQAGGVRAINYGAQPANNLTSITFKNMVIDDFYVSTNLLYNFDWKLSNNWDYQVMLHAFYTDGETNAGNALFKNSDITSIRLKKRYSGDFDWITIYEAPFNQNVNSLEALNIDYWDYLEPSKKTIEYAYTVVVDGIESDPVKASVNSKFYYYFLVGQNAEVYPALFNIDHSVQLNRESATIVSPGRKYPYIVTNGIANYYSGNFTATFMPHDEQYLPLPENGYNYRNRLDEFLTDGYAKILKTVDGDIYLISVVGGIQRNNNGSHYENIGSSFEWAEIGDPNNSGDLYDNGFINTDVDRNGG